MAASKEWHEALPDLYRAELEVLKNGLNTFKFIEQLPFEEHLKQLRILGELSINNGRKQIIQIVFPPAYPYSPPEIFPLNGRLTEHGLQVDQVLSPTGFKSTVSFNRGNQYANDKICLFKDEDVWIPFVHGIAMAINQARLWFEAALSPQGFTSDIIVEENLPIMNFAGQVFSYMAGQLPEAEKGTLKLKCFKENYYSLLEVSFHSEGEIKVHSTFPDGTILSPSRTEYILGNWFKIQGDPKIVLPSLANSEQLKNVLIHACKTGIDELLPNPEVKAKKTIVGFRIGGTNEIHCFQIYYWREGVSTKFQSTYLLPKNLSIELFARIESLFDLEVLKRKKVLIVGAGAIGSEVLKELSASSVGSYTVIEEDKFDAGNSVRHAADLLHVGESKAEIARKIIHGRNPLASVKVIATSIFNLDVETVSNLIDESDVILDLTANKLVEGYLNQKVCIEKGKPLVLAAVSKGGLTGNVLALIPGKSACLDCLRERKLTYVPVSKLNGEMLKNTAPDYGACSQPALPASGMDTREVAIQCARVTLQVLLADEVVFYPKLSGYQFYWHGPAGSDDHTPFEWEVKSVSSSDECSTCNVNP
jgi:molybdopterin/thiamine biosynthesis adenylyltransferase